jgi:hypothetical protein
MTEFENKIRNLKDELAAANVLIGDYTHVANQIKAEIKALEEANAPKQGDIYTNTLTDYIIARVECGKYCLINLTDGERYINPVSTISEVFGQNLETFVRVSR